MPDPISATPAASTTVDATPPRVERDLSKALVSEAPPPPAAPNEGNERRKPPAPAPSDGAERYRALEKDTSDDLSFFETIYKELDAMRMADPDARRLKLVVQAIVRRILDTIPKPVASPSPAAPPASPQP